MRRRWMVVPVVGCCTAVLGRGPATQTDWSGGPGTHGPVLEWEATFNSSSNVAWRSISGQLVLSAGPRSSPVSNIIAADAGIPKSIAVGDINGDGSPDVVSTDPIYDVSSDLGAVHWWQQGVGGAWTQHWVDGEFEGAYFATTADVDGDGDTDVVGCAYFGSHELPADPWVNGRYAWFENLNGSGTSWTQHAVGGRFFNGALHLAVADLDGDGDMDVAGLSALTDGSLLGFDEDGDPIFEQDADVVFFENADGAGTEWIQHDLDTDYQSYGIIRTADLDLDGDVDIIAGGDGSIAWWENRNGDGTSWLKRYVETALTSSAYLDVGDIDNDGDLDIIGGACHTNQIVWWENTSGTARVWLPRFVVGGRSGYVIELADMDGDGDLDALFCRGADAWWFENASGDGLIWNPVYITAVESGPWIAAGDLNGDGRINAAISDEGVPGGAPQLVWYDVTEFDHDETGELFSSVLDGGSNPDWGRMTWDAVEPGSTALTVEVRASDSEFELGPFITVESSGADLADLLDPNARYLQYRLLFDSDDPAVSPIVRQISVLRGLPGDFDGDGDVDLDDYSVLAACLAGPESPPDPGSVATEEGCLDNFDHDADGDVDLFDFSEFTAALAEA